MEDGKILDLYWERKEEAIEETDRKYGRMCEKIAVNLLFDHQDAQECVNDTYLGLWNSIPPKRPDLLSAYVAKLVRNISMKRLTYRNAQKRSSHGTVSIHELEQTIPDSCVPEERLEAEELAVYIECFLKSQSYESRNMFLRRYWFFDSVSDIALRFGVSESKVKSLLFRTRNRLYSYLLKEGILVADKQSNS